MFLYGNVLQTLYRRKKSTDFNLSAVVDAAQAAITKTAVSSPSGSTHGITS